MEFLAKLAQLQRDAGLSDAAFEKAIGKGGNYLGRLKKGKLPVPDEETTRKMARALQERGANITPDALWALAIPDKADDKVREHFGAEIERHQQDFERRLREIANITPDEQRLVESARSLQVAVERHIGRIIEANPRWPAEAIKEKERLDVAKTTSAFLDALSAEALRDALSNGRTPENQQAWHDHNLFVLLRSLLWAVVQLPAELRGDLLAALSKTAGGMFNAWSANHPLDALQRGMLDSGFAPGDVDALLRGAHVTPNETGGVTITIPDDDE